MNRINVWLNLFVVALLVVAGGYLMHAAGLGGSPTFSTPNDAWFRTAVLERSQPVVVKFGAPWCGPCRMLDPELDRLANSGQVAVVRIEIERHRELAHHYRVSSIPDLFLFHHGAVVAHRVGYANCDQLRKWIACNVSQ